MSVPSQRPEAGSLGELLASEELARRGYAILATRYRSRFGEIDIVCRRDGVLGFVEVKARRAPARSSDRVKALDAISFRKQRRISAMALDYLAWAGRLDAPCRFIVVAIDGLGTSRQTMTVVEDAWTVDS